MDRSRFEFFKIEKFKGAATWGGPGRWTGPSKDTTPGEDPAGVRDLERPCIACM